MNCLPTCCGHSDELHPLLLAVRWITSPAMDNRMNCLSCYGQSDELPPPAIGNPTKYLPCHWQLDKLPLHPLAVGQTNPPPFCYWQSDKLPPLLLAIRWITAPLLAEKQWLERELTMIWAIVFSMSKCVHCL